MQFERQVSPEVVTGFGQIEPGQMFVLTAGGQSGDVGGVVYMKTTTGGCLDLSNGHISTHSPNMQVLPVRGTLRWAPDLDDPELGEQ